MDAVELVGRLEREFGLGESAVARLGFYRKVAAAAEKDPRVLRVTRETALLAATKRCPDRWFCRVLLLRLGELGLMKEERKHQALAAGVFADVGS